MRGRLSTVPNVHREERASTVSADVGVEEELLRSIEEVEDRIRAFRKKVRAVLASARPPTGSEVIREEKA